MLVLQLLLLALGICVMHTNQFYAQTFLRLWSKLHTMHGSVCSRTISVVHYLSKFSLKKCTRGDNYW